MNSAKKPKAKLLMLFGAVLIFQCCCCIIPYSWNARLDSSTFAAPLETEEDIYIAPRESLKAEATLEGLAPSTLDRYFILIETFVEAVPGQLGKAAQETAANQTESLSWLKD
jgi:hypothetical protein